MIKKIITAVIGLFAASAGIQADNASLDTVKVLSGGYTSATYQRISCHDPSIFIDTITSATPVYYIYGSHLGRGRTTAANNYQTWSLFKSGEESTGTSNSLFANTSGTLVNYSNAYNTHKVTKVKDCNGNEVDFGNFNAHEWQYTGYGIRGNQWAPDVIWNKTMKKWCMYMSINGDHWASVIVCLTSDSPMGPWVYQGPVVFSGFQGTYDHVGFTKSKDYQKTDLQIAIGNVSALPSRYSVGGSWGDYWPNCIDPCVFYDDDDNLWMSYGSWSGGIFMLKLNPENGLRDYEYKFPYQVNGTTTTNTSANKNCTCDPYFGKKIAGGYYVSGEASYIEKIGKYYFLFMSYGGLQSDGGYQMRIFRSEKPDGPYKDVQNNNAIYTSYQLNYNKNSQTNRGVLLFGGYKWDTMPDAELAQGHNSAFTDVDGRSFVVYHTRFANGGEGHQVRVHQLYLNQDGWLVSAPFEFKGEKYVQSDIETKSLFTTDQIVGTYQLIRHTYCQDTQAKAYQSPVNITLNEDGTVSGTYTGTWEVPEGTSFINLKLGSVTYKGVLTEQVIDYTKVSKGICISAISSSSGSYTNTSTNTKGLEIWAVKAKYMTALQYTFNNIKIPISNGMTITKDIQLPTKGMLGAKVEWLSSDESVITSNGQIAGNGEATLTLAITFDGHIYLKDYNVKVNNDITTYYPKVGSTSMNTGYLAAFSDPYTLKKGETVRFMFYNHCKKATNWENWLLCCYNNTSRSTNYFILRADNWEDKAGGNNGCTSNFNWDTFKADMDGALVNMTVTYSTDGKVVMKSTITTTSGKVYNYDYTYPSTLTLSEVVLFFSVNNAYIESGSLNGIEEIIAESDMERNTFSGIYDLSGRRLKEIPAKGIFIVNGRKFVKK